MTPMALPPRQSDRLFHDLLLLEELAYVSSSVAATYDVHCILAGNALAFGSSALKDRWLRPLVAGDVVGAFATTEPGASSDLSVDALQTETSGSRWPPPKSARPGIPRFTTRLTGTRPRCPGPSWRRSCP